jgi:hypothetical protein
MDIIQLLPYSATGMLDKLRASADAIDQVSDTVTYLGFCLPGTMDTNINRWSIMKIQVFNTETYFMWANGVCLYNLLWDSRAGYTYYFKGF